MCVCVQAERADSPGVTYRGVYVFRFNAEDLVKPYDASVKRSPDLSMVSLSQEMHASLTSSTTAVLGGTSSNLAPLAYRLKHNHSCAESTVQIPEKTLCCVSLQCCPQRADALRSAVPASDRSLTSLLAGF